MKKKKALLLSALAIAMTITTSAQIHKDAFGMKTREKVFVQMNGMMNAPAKEAPLPQELLACPEGTVFGGEYSAAEGVWTGTSTADEGRSDISTTFYQYFNGCYYKFSGVRFLGLFNYFNLENYAWTYCQDRDEINEDGEMIKPIKVKVAFYKDNGEDVFNDDYGQDIYFNDYGKYSYPGDLVYSKEFDVIGEKTGVVMGNSTDGYCNVYAFNIDLGEEINMEHGFMQINAVDVNNAVSCNFSLLTSSSSPGYSLVKGDWRDGSKPEWLEQMSCCYCFDGDGSFISDNALKFTRILSPEINDANKFGKVQVELMNIGANNVDNTELQLWQDNKLLATEKVNANIGSLDKYKYTFNTRVNCTEPGIHMIRIKNVTPNSDKIAVDTIVTKVVKPDDETYAPSGSEETNYFYITRVTIGDIDKKSRSTSYSNFTDIKTDIKPGQELPLKVECNSEELFLGAWIDWNSNGVFENNEVIEFSKEKVANVKIPTDRDVKLGDKRLRIVFAFGDDKPTGIYLYGETEDYTLVVKNNENTPILGLETEMIYEQTQNDSKNVAIELANNGEGTLTTDIDFCYILPNAPTTNYSMNKVSAPKDMQVNIIRKTTEKTAKNPEKTDETQYVLRYDNSQHDIVRIDKYNNAIFANYFPGQMLSNLKGMKISSVDVYVANSPQSSSIVIYGEKTQNRNGGIITDQVFEAQENAWNHVELDSPVIIGENDLWIGYKADGMQSDGFIIGVDKGKGVLGYGDRLYIGGDTWWSAGDLGLDYNYCIRANVTGERTSAINWLSIDSEHLDVEKTQSSKLNVNIDASKLDNDFYEAKIEIKTNDELRSIINIPVYVINGKTTGIIDKEFTGGAIVKISGKNIDINSDKVINHIQVFDLSGRLVRAIKVGSKNFNATVDGLNDNLYILKMNYADSNHYTIKVPVIK